MAVESEADKDVASPSRNLLQECAFGGKPRALWDELSALLKRA